MSIINRRAFLTRVAAAAIVTGSVSQCNLLSGVCVPVAQTFPHGRRRPFFSAGKKHPEVIAHRGGRREWPEETLFAYKEASKIGVDVLEMDVRSSSDGHLVLMHNDRVDATTNGTGQVHDMSLKQLQDLDAGYHWSANGHSFPFRGKGYTVTTLEQVFRELPDMRMNIEIKQRKPSIVAPLVELIRTHHMQDKVLIASFWGSVIQAFREQCPEVATSASTDETLEFLANESADAASMELEADAIQMKDKLLLVPLLHKKQLNAAHQRDLAVHAWTVNEKSDMKRLIDSGVDGIITDYPSRLLSVLHRLPA